MADRNDPGQRYPSALHRFACIAYSLEQFLSGFPCKETKKVNILQRLKRNSDLLVLISGAAAGLPGSHSGGLTWAFACSSGMLYGRE